MDGEWLEDAFGPDAVRVTFCFTTAVSRYAQALSGIGIAGRSSRVNQTSASAHRLGDGSVRNCSAALRR
jgi:hypothetical protein